MLVIALPSTGSDSGNNFVASLRLFCVNISLKSAFVATNATLMTPLNELFNNELREVWQRCNKNKKFIVCDNLGDSSNIGCGQIH